MALYIKNPDSVGACCECSSRPLPCDSCGPTCSLSGCVSYETPIDYQFSHSISPSLNGVATHVGAWSFGGDASFLGNSIDISLSLDVANASPNLFSSIGMSLYFDLSSSGNSPPTTIWTTNAALTGFRLIGPDWTAGTHIWNGTFPVGGFTPTSFTDTKVFYHMVTGGKFSLNLYAYAYYIFTTVGGGGSETILSGEDSTIGTVVPISLSQNCQGYSKMVTNAGELIDGKFDFRWPSANIAMGSLITGSTYVVYSELLIADSGDTNWSSYLSPSKTFVANAGDTGRLVTTGVITNTLYWFSPRREYLISGCGITKL